MAPDPSVIAALQAALSTDPDNVAVRLHLAGLLLAGGDAPGALEQAARVLASHPDQADALATAARACEQSGDTARAASFRRILDALALDR